MASAQAVTPGNAAASPREFTTGYPHLDAMISAFAFSLFLRGFWHTLTYASSIPSAVSYGWNTFTSTVWKTFTAAAGFLFDTLTATTTSTLTHMHALGMGLLETAAFTLVISLVGRAVLFLEDRIYKHDTKNSRAIKQLISAAAMCATAYVLTLSYLCVAGAVIANIFSDTYLQQKTTDQSDRPPTTIELQPVVGGDDDNDL